jgi:hypothetical protein
MLFLESPWPILIAGLVLEMALAIVLFRTGRGAVAAAMGVLAVLVLLGVLLERWTVTDTKRVQQTLNAAAAGLQTNSAMPVTACIVPGPDGDRARELVDSVFKQVEFIELSINNLEVKFNYRTTPPTAETTLTVWARVKIHADPLAGEYSRPVAMTVQLRKESGRWLIYGEPTYKVRE